jgi:hypothetical protein
MRQPTTSKRNIRARENENKVLDLRRQGISYEKIHRITGLSISGAHAMVKRVMERLTEYANETADEIKKQELLRLDEMQAALYKKAVKGDIRAIDAVLRIMQRRAKLLGLDEPEKVDLGVYEIEPPKKNADTKD